MANKRIQKKRDKRDLILKTLKFSYTEMPESLYELHRTIRIMRKMTMPELIQCSDRVMRAWVFYHTPFRNILPRRTWDEPIVQWRQVTSMEATPYG